MAREAHNFLVNVIFERRLASVAATSARGRLLDIGCGTKPYAAMLRPYVDEHIGLDLATSIHGTDMVDLVGTAYEIPVEDGSFDTILCTFVRSNTRKSQHRLSARHTASFGLLESPFTECLSSEEPRDFFRYAKHGLRYLFEQAGFDLCELEALAGLWVTMDQFLAY